MVVCVQFNRKSPLPREPLHALHIINNELMNANQSCRIDLSTSFICGGFAEF